MKAKKSRPWMLVAIGLLALVAIAVTAMKIPLNHCCDCGWSYYKMYPLVLTIYENYVTSTTACDCSLLGCGMSFWIIPIDVIILLIILVAYYAYSMLRKGKP